MRRKQRMLNLLKERRVISSAELLEMGISAPLTNFRRLIEEGVEVYRIDLRRRGGTGSSKYKSSKLLKPDTPNIIYSVSLRDLSDYLKNIFRFELTYDLDWNKKKALTHYLRGRVPEKIMRDLGSLYTRKRGR